MKNLLVCFAAGCLGGLINSIVVWQFGELGVARWAGVAIEPALTLEWLYPRIVWGGIWGWLFVLPVLNARFLLKGTVLSLAPTALQLFFIFPNIADKGLAGLQLGMWTPAAVLFYNWVWGVTAATAVRLSK